MIRGTSPLRAPERAHSFVSPPITSTSAKLTPFAWLVAVTVTVRGKHSGEYQGLAPTGRSIAFEEAIFWQLRDGKIASQVVIVDTAGALQQLTAK